MREAWEGEGREGKGKEGRVGPCEGEERDGNLGKGDCLKMWPGAPNHLKTALRQTPDWLTYSARLEIVRCIVFCDTVGARRCS